MNTTEAVRKPVGRNYGSIPHLPGSRRGPGDHGLTEAHARIATTKRRDAHDTVIVQEKLDGSNVGVAKLESGIIAIMRAGYLADTSPHRMHHLFSDWVAANAKRFDELLQVGERVCGEWLAQAHGTRYSLRHEPFVAFDIMRAADRVPFEVFRERVGGRLTMPAVLHYGDALGIDAAMEKLGEYGFHGATDQAEGAVWRVERKGRVDFLCKYVRPGKIDGRYLPEVTGRDEVWNLQIAGPYATYATNSSGTVKRF